MSERLKVISFAVRSFMKEETMLIFNCFLFSLARKTASCISAENGGPLIV